MPGFASYDSIITNCFTNGQKDHFDFVKQTISSGSVLTWYSSFIGPGNPGAGTYSSQANTAQVGSINFSNVSPKTRHLLSFGVAATNPGIFMLYDRLVEVSGISSATTGSKTISTAALPRYNTNALSVGVQAWLEVTTAQNVGADQFHLLSYTNNSGTAGRVGPIFTCPAVATGASIMLGPLPLQAGDLGVQAVSTINVDAADTSGVFSVVLLRPLAYVYVHTGAWNERDLVVQHTNLERLYDGHSLHIMYYNTGSAATPLPYSGTIVCGYN